MIKNQVKLAVAIGATIFSARAAKAAPRPPCFLRGTKIRMVDGERNIEDISVGDRVLTAFGQSRDVRWAGRWLAWKRGDETWSEDLRPVRIRKSALGSNMPYADLYVTQGHAIFIDGVLVPAGQLINGTSITLHDAQEMNELEYFHIKLTTHDVVLAAGVPSETLLKYLPGAMEDQPAGDDLGGDEVRCAPVVCNGKRGRIMARARGWAAPWLGPQKLDIIRARLQEQAAAIAS
jgi:hypothetical protein